MTRSILKAAMLAAGLLSASAAFAQGAPQMTRVEGKVTALSDSQIVITKADGASVTVPLLMTAGPD